jgi:TetR/AcrR family transcriptional repressor of lmrAB and yxaGH operons
MASDSRERMVRSAASLIGARGMTATSFTDVIADSGAPRGSIYHHFPDGKEQLAAAAIGWTCDQVLSHISASSATTPDAVLENFVELWRQSVLRSDATAGCAVAGVALDTTAMANGLMDVARTAFRSWVDALAAQLKGVGVPAKRAKSVAVAAVAAMEGALILCRAEGAVTPLETIAAELHRLLAAGPDDGQRGARRS